MPCIFKPNMHHTCLRIMPCLCDGCLLCCLLSFRCCLFLLVPVTSHLWGSIRLCPFVFFMDSFFFLAGSHARWPYPQNHFYLFLLVAHSIAMPMFRYLPLAISCLPYCHVKPLTNLVLANRCLAMLPLCSAPLIALIVAGEDWSFVPCWNMEIVPCWNMDILLGYHNISYLINPSIYLVKGGRLGLMPGVLFHSCCPSFHHIGAMFPDFAFLTRLGYNGNPLTVRFE